jgi:tetratricopeptide (TPR) repeat protein
LGIVRIRKNPLFSFAILFFFLNHAVESTVIHLELIFEHRNYLPSLFLFLPIAAFMVEMICKSNKTCKYSSLLKPALILFCLIFISASGIATYQRNQVWKNDSSLWQDAVLKAPKNGRAKLNLAGSYLDKKQFSAAMTLCNQAEKLQGATKNKLIPISLNIKGNIAYAQGNLEQAATFFQQALSLRNDYIDVSYKLIAVLIEQGKLTQALALVNSRYLATRERNLLLIKASLLLRLDQPGESLLTYQQASRLFRESPLPLISQGMGKALSMQGFFTRADILLNWAAKKDQGTILLLIENNLNAGKDKRAAEQIRQLLQSVPLKRLLDRLSPRQTDAYQIPFNSTLLHNAVLHVVKTMPVVLPDKP